MANGEMVERADVAVDGESCESSRVGFRRRLVRATVRVMSVQRGNRPHLGIFAADALS